MAPTYEDRVVKGVYDRCKLTIKSDDRSFEKLNPDLFYACRSNTWGGNKTTTRFYRHPSGSRSSEIPILLVGEVLGRAKGTAMGGLGGSNLPPGATVNDKSYIKDVMAIGIPTLATPDIKTIWTHQITALQKLYDKDIGYKCEKSRWVTGEGDHATISITLDTKYRTPPKNEQDTKHRKTNEDADIADAHEHKRQHPEGRVNDDFISLGMTYPPNVLDDFDPEVMLFKEARLVQLNLVDTHGKLVAPWNAQKKFRPGTLVLVEAHLNVHQFPSTGTRESFCNYQVAAFKVKAVGASPTPFDPLSLQAPRDLGEFDDIAGDAGASSSSSEEVDDALKYSKPTDEFVEGSSQDVDHGVDVLHVDNDDPMEEAPKKVAHGMKRRHKK